MTREEQLDWLCRLRSEIYVYMPKEWLIPMNNALDMVIKELEQEQMQEKASIDHSINTGIEFDYRPINPFQNDGLSDEDRLLIDAIRKTAYICGRRVDDIEYTVHQVLKQIGRTDLLPPCERK